MRSHTEVAVTVPAAGTERAVILVIMQEARNFSLHVIRLLEVGEGCRAFEELALDFGREIPIA